MASEIKSITPESSIQSKTETRIPEPRFAVSEMLEWDDTDWQDFLSQHADTGVGR